MLLQMFVEPLIKLNGRIPAIVFIASPQLEAVDNARIFDPNAGVA